MFNKIEVVTIGNELLDGLVVNTNAAFICHELTAMGLTVGAYHALPDNPAALKASLEHILKNNTLVICTGGLGPTCDDNTKQVVAEIFDSGFRFDDGIAANLKERYGIHLASLQHQATVPAKATVFPNALGTAPALLFEANTVTLILLPGVSLEMRAIWDESVKPYLLSRLPEEARQLTQYLLLTSLKEDEVDPLLRKIEKELPDIAIGIYAKPGLITVALSCSEGPAHSQLEQAKDLIVEAFHDRTIVSKSGKIEEEVHQLLTNRGLTVSTAESCTGGAIGARLTSLPGASRYYLGSIIAYSIALKKKLLGVPETVLSQHGAVSEEAVIEMARGALFVTGSDYSVAVTGVAGPGGGTEQKPVGTVWVAIANKAGFVLTWHLSIRGPREKIITATVNAALCRLWQTVNYF
jgi:nicotinamide-nucleotide amidase